MRGRFDEISPMPLLSIMNNNGFKSHFGLLRFTPSTLAGDIGGPRRMLMFDAFFSVVLMSTSYCSIFLCRCNTY